MEIKKNFERGKNEKGEEMREKNRTKDKENWGKEREERIKNSV
jgi:hypothetical protein